MKKPFEKTKSIETEPKLTPDQIKIMFMDYKNSIKKNEEPKVEKEKKKYNQNLTHSRPLSIDRSMAIINIEPDLLDIKQKEYLQ